MIMKNKLLRKIMPALLMVCMMLQSVYAEGYPFEEAECDTLPRLERLAELCRMNGIDTSYEDTNIQIIRDYIEYGKEINEIDFSKGRYVSESIDRIADKTEEALVSYLNEECVPKEASVFTGGNVSIDGRSFIGDTTKGEKPVFFVGYNNSATDIDKLDKYGINFMQTEMGPHSYILDPSNAKWKYTGKNVHKINRNESYSGDGCLEINNTAGDSFVFYQDISLSAGSYTLKYYVKGSNVSGGSVKYGNKNSLEVARNFGSVTDNWKLQSYNITLRTAQTIRIAIDASAQIDKLFIDDITLIKSGTNYILQGDFENDFVQYVPVDDETNKIGLDYAVSVNRYYNEIEPVFDTAAEKNIKIDFIISPHYLPMFIRNNGLAVTWPSNFGTMLNYDIFSDKAKAVIEEYIKFIVPKISEKKALLSICITNEPKYQIAYIDGFFEKHPEIKNKWTDYLKSRYSSIAELNTAYGTSYADFTDVEMSLASKTTQLYDTKVFNAEVLSEWHSWLAGLVKKYAPGVPVHSKIMNSFNYADGMHPEMSVLGGYGDLGGNDAYNLYTSDRNVNAEYLSNKMMWYDFVGSFAKVPVINSENHLIYDTGEGLSPYRKEVSEHVRADLWQGAIHGRSATALWAWEKSLDKTNLFYDSFGSRPDAVSAAAETTLDLNRLSEYVSAFQNADADVGILYSEASAVYGAVDMRRIYPQLNQSGHKVIFVSEKQISEGCDLPVIVIPKGTDYVEEETVAALNSYIADGGKVIVFENDLTYNTKMQTNTAKLSDDAVTVPENEDVLPYFIGVMSAKGLDSVVAFENDLRLTGVDYKSIVKDGKVYINICSPSEKYITLKVEGETPENAKDLISGEHINTEKIHLKAYTPVLIEIGGISDEFISGITAETTRTGCIIAWKNNTSCGKNLTLYDEKGKIVNMLILSADDIDAEFTGLNSGEKYRAVISNGEHTKEKEFTVKRQVVTTIGNGWSLDYRGQDAYNFTEGEYSIEAQQNNSSLRLELYNKKMPFVYYKLWRDIRLTKNITYRYTVKYKTDRYDETDNAYFRVSPDGDNTYFTETTKGDGEWHTFTFDYTPSATGNRRLIITVECGGVILLDDISVYATSNGAVTGSNLISGGDFEDSSYITVPEKPKNVAGIFTAPGSVLLSWEKAEDVKKVNVYRNGVFVTSSESNSVSVSAKPWDRWNYSITSVDENGNESEAVEVSGESMGSVTEPEFYYTESGIGVRAYAYEDAELYIAVYSGEKLETVGMTFGTGWLDASVTASDAENKQIAAYVWKNGKPLGIKYEKKD